MIQIYQHLHTCQWLWKNCSETNSKTIRHWHGNTGGSLIKKYTDPKRTTCPLIFGAISKGKHFSGDHLAPRWRPRCSFHWGNQNMYQHPSNIPGTKWTNPTVDKVCDYHFFFHQMGTVAAEFHFTDPPVRKWRNSRPKYEWFMFYHGWKNRSHQSKNLWNLHLFSDDSPNLFIYSVPCIRPGHLMGSTHRYVSLLLKWPLPKTSSCPAQCIVHLDNHRAASPVRA